MEPGRKKIPIPRISSTINRIDLTKTSGDGERLQRYNNEAKDSMPRCLHACTPCRTSKLKCDGRLPCDTCRKGRSQPRCTYGPKSRRPIAAKPTPINETTEESSFLHQSLYGQHSLASLIEQFKALAFPFQAHLIDDAVTYCDGHEAFEAAKNDAIMTSKTHRYTNTLNDFAFTIAAGTNSAQMVPRSRIAELDYLYTSTLSMQKIIAQGRLLEAWTEMSRLVRQAELSYLRIDYTDPAQSMYWNQLWWTIIGLDIQINMIVGRRSAIPFHHGIQRPKYTTSTPELIRLATSRLDFRQYALPILETLSYSECAITKLTEYRTLLQVVNLDRLSQIITNIPGSSTFDKVDRKLEVLLGEHSLEVQTFQLMICCILSRSKQRQTCVFNSARENCTKQSPCGNEHSLTCWSAIQKHDLYGFQATIIKACISIIISVQRITSLEQEEQQPDWIKIFTAYTAVSILAIESIRSGVVQHGVRDAIFSGRTLFEHLDTQTPGLEFANIAKSRTHALWSEIKTLRDVQDTRQAISPKTEQPTVHRKRTASLNSDSPKRFKAFERSFTRRNNSVKSSADKKSLKSGYEGIARSTVPYRPCQFTDTTINISIPSTTHNSRPVVGEFAKSTIPRVLERTTGHGDLNHNSVSVAFHEPIWNTTATAGATYPQAEHYQTIATPWTHGVAAYQYPISSDLITQQQLYPTSGFSEASYHTMGPADSSQMSSMADRHQYLATQYYML